MKKDLSAQEVSRRAAIIRQLVLAAMGVLHHDANHFDPKIIRYEIEPLRRKFAKILTAMHAR